MLDASLLPALYDALTVARHGSVARAADTLHKTPSAVSQQLRRIEEHFGVALFARAGRGIGLTAAGEAFLGPATRLFDEAESVYALLGSMGGSPVTTVRLAVSDYLGKELLAPVLREMHESGAPLRFAIVTSHSADSVRLLERGEVDAAIVSTAAPHPALDEHLLFEQPMLWVASRLPEHKPVHERLGSEPVLRLSAGSLGRALLDAYLERHNIAPVSTIEVPSVSLLVSYAATGVGIGLAPALPLHDAASESVIVERADVPPIAVRLALRPSYPLSLPLAAFLERVRARGARLAEELTAVKPRERAKDRRKV
ncbi:MAG TPA: LysR family transcriptional regulator [Candidatus Limnocylindrales bacterium]|nr:LysR family transcriptional regulator [Candidatus Limnocylindrales bacterium]